jgi:hypothetical protein
MADYDIDAALARIREAQSETEGAIVPEVVPEADESVGGMFRRFMDGAQDFGGRFLEGVMDPVYGASQFLENSVEEFAPGVVDAVGNADARLYDFSNGWFGKPAGVDVDEQLKRREAAYGDKYNVDGTDWARLGGNVATGVALAPAAIGSSLPATAMALAAEGAAGGAFMPQVGEGDYWKQAQDDALMGAITGGVGGTALRQGGKALTSRLNREGLGVLKEAGVQPTVGQALGGMADRTEQKLGSVPFFGDLINDARRRAQGELREAAFQRVAGPLGQTATKTGTEGVEQAHRFVDEAYDAAKQAMPKLNIADDFSGKIDSMIDGFDERGFAPDTIKQFRKLVDNKVLGRIGDAGELGADQLKLLDSELGDIVAKGSPEMKTMAAEMQQTMMDMAAKQSPEYAAQLAKADEAFSKTAVLDIVGGKGEKFTPKQLEAAIKANDKTARKNGFARGKGPLRDLSRPGVENLTDSVADSGTIGRALMSAPILGGTAFNPMVLAGAAGAYGAGALGATRTGQKGIIGLLDILGKGGEKVGREGRALGGLFSYLNDDEDDK